MKKNRAQKDILYITISSFILVVAWVGFNLYHTYTTTTISEDLQMQIIPIDRDFDTTTIQQLKKRTKVAPFNEIKNTTSPTPTTSQASASANTSPTNNTLTP